MFAPFRKTEFLNAIVEPTKIHGRPTYTQLRKLEIELIKYATNIASDQGGGQHGYLGLIKSATEYLRIAGEAFNKPVRPPITYAMASGTPGHETLRLQQEHYKAHEEFQECEQVERTLGRMIQSAIDYQYLKEFISTNTYHINRPIHEVLSTLYTKYGQVRRQDVKNKEREVENINYQLTEPLTDVWTELDDLQKLATRANLKYSDRQMVEMGMNIIKNTHDFEQGIYEWEKKPAADKTYDNLKTHFNDELERLQNIRGDDMLQSTHHQVNVMRSAFNDITNTMKDEMSDDIQIYTNKILTAIREEKENAPPPDTQAINAATLVEAMNKLVNVISGLESRISQMETTCRNATPQTNCNDPNYHIPFWMRPNNRFKYCWSCGSNATHDGSSCTCRKEGHIETATYQNRQGGSINRIPKRFRDL